MNSWMLATLVLLASLVGASGSPTANRTFLDVPCIRQTPQRCGPAALEMVLRYYGSGEEAHQQAASAYDAALRGSLITDLATAARRAGHEARVAVLSSDSIIALLRADVPVIVLYQSGRPPLTRAHFGVVTGWEPEPGRFTLHDGRAEPRQFTRAAFEQRWRTAGGVALIVERERMPAPGAAEGAAR